MGPFPPEVPVQHLSCEDMVTVTASEGIPISSQPSFFYHRQCSYNFLHACFKTLFSTTTLECLITSPSFSGFRWLHLSSFFPTQRLCAKDSTSTGWSTGSPSLKSPARWQVPTHIHCPYSSHVYIIATCHGRFSQSSLVPSPRTPFPVPHQGVGGEDGMHGFFGQEETASRQVTNPQDTVTDLVLFKIFVWFIRLGAY